MAKTDVLDAIEKKVGKLDEIADDVKRLGKKLFEKAPIQQDIERVHSTRMFAPAPEPRISYHWGILNEELRTLQHETIRKYQQFYSLSLLLIKEYLAEREPEFVQYYQDAHYQGLLMDLQLKNTPYNQDRLPIIQKFENKLEIQRSILLSIIDVVEIKESTLRKIITSDIVKTEIEQAEILFEKGFSRAGGVLAGIALELHLKTLCDLKGITYGLNATIDPIATDLYKAKALDITELNQMKRLASIRNKCAHGEQISENNIISLIEEVKKII